MGIMLQLNILAIGAHPDDIELGCGGLLIKSARLGHNVYLYTLTQGEAGGNPKERVAESEQSSRIIGAKSFLIDNFKDTMLDLSSQIINRI